ncbi:MAG: Ldh family oxidoreductase [Phaeodactylibacter sp.]|nr:Ldh family oxidoreductase [Phaeodactylibacter sp.]
MPEPRYNHEELIRLASTLLQKTGLAEERARIVAETLTEADLMGHSTHGLALLPAYLKEIETGGMAVEGEPELVQDQGAAITWDGRYLPGPWLMHKAIGLALERAAQHPVVTMVIRRSHHIACLAAYPERATRQGLLMILSCSDPINKTVAPFGGLEAVYSPNPIAAGIPTQGGPIIIDVSTSTTANGLVVQKYRAGERLPHPWLLDSQGRPTDDPAAFFGEPPATILPLGGLDAGYKGFALGLLVEALANGLGGYGRAAHPNQWGSSVFLQVLNPGAFGGLEYFRKEMNSLAEACLSSPATEGGPPVRLPGHRALALREEQRENGVRLYPGIAAALEENAVRYGMGMPEPYA